MFVRANSPVLLLPAALLLAGCAAISSPEGGPRDTTAPKLVSTSPANGATNVTQQSLRLTFSEQVQLKDLSKNLLITPSIPESNPYKVFENRAYLELRFAKPLEANTTYVFNFRDAVRDITESNPARDVIVAFSTGASLDSGRVRGTVTRLLTGQPEGEITVALYKAGDTTDVRRHAPYYQTRADKNGSFELRNLREGQYRIYAIVDKNNNSHYDEPERIAYLAAPINVNPHVDSLRLLTVRPDSKRPLILSQQSTSTQYKVGYNEGLSRFTLAALGQPAAPGLQESVIGQEQGRAVVVLRSPEVPAGRYLLSATDSAGNVSLDTLNVKFDGKDAAPRRGAMYQVVGNPREINRQGQLKLQFAEPVRVVGGKPFGTLLEDSTTRRPLRLPADGTLSPDRSLLTIQLDTKAKERVTFIPDTTALVSFSGQPLRLRPVRLRLTDQANTGSLSGSVQTAYKSYELLLLDDKQQVARRLSSPRTFHFDNLDPGTYTLRVLIDADNDGRWYSGDPQLQRPAEPVYQFPQPQKVRANWEIEKLEVKF